MQTPLCFAIFRIKQGAALPFWIVPAPTSTPTIYSVSAMAAAMASSTTNRDVVIPISPIAAIPPTSAKNAMMAPI